MGGYLSVADGAAGYWARRAASYLTLGHSVPGFPFLASLIAIFSGAQLFSLGIIGEYLARMHVRSLEQPTYVIRSLAGGTATNTSQSEHARDE